jgi:hypothetical protein
VNVPADTARALITGRQRTVRIPITNRRKPKPGSAEPVRPVHLDQLIVEDDDGTQVTYDLRQVGKSIGRVLILDIHTYRDTSEWELRVRPIDTVRLLAPAARPSHFDPNDEDDPASLGYTTSQVLALADEPEALDTACLHPDWKTAAELRQREVRTRTLEQRIADARRAAELHDIDIRRQERRLEAAAEALERKVKAKTEGRAA